KLWYAMMHIIEKAVGQRKQVAFAYRMEECDAYERTFCVRHQLLGWYIALKHYFVGYSVLLCQFFGLIVEVSLAADYQFFIYQFHGGDELFKTPSLVYPALVKYVIFLLHRRIDRL